MNLFSGTIVAYLAQQQSEAWRLVRLMACLRVRP